MNFAAAVTDWYDATARDLPWRQTGVDAWGVMVSEFMLQQTPAARVIPAWHAWMDRWPTPADLAAAPSGEAVRQWARLGYPRRALRLHAAATAITADHDGQVPSSYDELVALPGVGDYTASAILAFAFDQRAAVLDTNVRRVYARWGLGRESPATTSVGAEERLAALAMVPVDRPGRYSVAVMELGALVCTARTPRCDACPVSASCEWLALGSPANGLRRPGQSYAGTDRQVRGRLLAVLRESPSPVPIAALDVVWSDVAQRQRALDSLLDDGLAVINESGEFHLPH